MNDSQFAPSNFIEADVRQPELKQIDFPKPNTLQLVESGADGAQVFETPPEQWLQRVLQAILETLHGFRQPAQLRSVVSAPTLQALQQRRAFITAFNRRTVPRITTMKFWNSTDCEIEMSAICEISGRYFPIALRLKQQATTWIVVACEIGPY